MSANQVIKAELNALLPADSDDEDGQMCAHRTVQYTAHRHRHWNIWSLATMLVVSHATAVLVAVFWLRRMHLPQFLSTNCEEPLSPFMSDIDTRPHTVTWPEFAWTPNKFTQSFRTAGDAVDDEWIELGAFMKAPIIPIEYASDFDIRDDHAIVDPNMNMSVPYRGYPADLQVFHKLHCLNLIRQALYYNVEHYRGHAEYPMWAPGQELVIEPHIAHCIDDMRLSIMCEADLRVVPYHVDRYGALPDFARQKTCRNFESVRSWMLSHQWEGAVDWNVTAHKHNHS